MQVIHRLLSSWRLNFCSISKEESISADHPPAQTQCKMTNSRNYAVEQELLNYSAWDPQNNRARACGPPSKLEMAYNVVHSRAHALLDLRKHKRTKA